MTTATTGDDEGQDLDLGDFFQEPENFRPPPKPPTFSEHRMQSGQVLKVRVVGDHPLYGYLLWNAGNVIAEYLEDRAHKYVHGKDILELGAGAGLPSLVCSLKGARTVVVTDYPDLDLVQNLQVNASFCEELLHPEPSPLHVEGYKWGVSPEKVFSYLPSAETKIPGFDVLILADVIYNHPQHHNLISTMKMTLKKNSDAIAFVAFTPYQPWLLDKITAFFPLAEASGFTVTKIFEHVLDDLLFQDDPGDEKLRRTVFGYELRWRHEELSS